MKEEIKNSINDESKEKRKLNDADLAQVTGGTDEPWRYCNHNCSDCNASNCYSRGIPYTVLQF